MQRVQRGRWAPLHNEGRHYDKTFTTALTGKENQANRAFGAMKILSPFGALRHHLSPSSRGHYGYCKLCHMTSRESVEQFIFPRNRCGKRTWFVGERYRPENQMKRFPVEKYRAAGIGVHFQRAKLGFTVFAANGSASAKGGIQKLYCREAAIHHPLNLLNPGLRGSPLFPQQRSILCLQNESSPVWT